MYTGGNYTNLTVQNETGGNDVICGNLKPLDEFTLLFRKPQGYITLGIAVIGIWFNIINMIILLSPKMRNPVNILLTVISSIETLFLLTYVPNILIFTILHPEDRPRYTTESKAAAYFLMLYAGLSIFLHMSILWMIITTACFRYLIVKFPISAAKWCTTQRAILASTLTIASCGMCSFLNFYINGVAKLDPADVSPCFKFDANVTTLWTVGGDGDFYEANFWLCAFTGNIIPSILITLFTAFLVRLLHEAEQRRTRLRRDSRRLTISAQDASKNATPTKKLNTDTKEFRQTTQMLLAVGTLFSAIELPHGVFLLWCGVSNEMLIYKSMGEIIDLLTLIAFAINFVLYCTMSRQYRILFIELLTHPVKFQADAFNPLKRSNTHKAQRTEHLSINDSGNQSKRSYMSTNSPVSV